MQIYSMPTVKEIELRDLFCLIKIAMNILCKIFYTFLHVKFILNIYVFIMNIIKL